MSDAALNRSGSWARAWIVGAFVPFAIGTTLSLVIEAWRGLSSEQGLDFADWSPGILPFAMLTATIASAVALCFVLLARFAERRGPRPLHVWLLLGIAAATPIALLFEGFMAVEPFERWEITIWSYLLPALYLYIASMIGALTAWRVRRGAWHA
ncbi:hypothetical protein HZY97_00685 [Sphingomonas sp. R-74633]|uniref:hypothetical protein n=1 Tax=Sphingomonas sp. R-74633 TaxID=2751188 RepID=UPI0015D1034B|nr:hypothetical protein [Sphingomonas sp. R-74633]NYT39260.1 hypothetical protein [Sphingomonas sp. R-74633]